MSIERLVIAEKVLSGTEVEFESTPIPIGKKVTIHEYFSSCPDSANATTRIEFGGIIIDCMQRSDRHLNINKMPDGSDLIGDGVKTVSLFCLNECSSDYYFKANAIIGFK